MIVEVTGTGTANKGAELMLAAIRLHFWEVDPELRLVVTTNFGGVEKRRHYGLGTRLDRHNSRRSFMMMKFMPARFRAILGKAVEADIDAVIDASGFAFGDQCGPHRVEAFARDVRRWKRQGKRVILLPQALGPFDDPRVRAAFRVVIEKSDLIYARDEISFEATRILVDSASHVRLAPDCTIPVKGRIAEQWRNEKQLALIVPNQRMIEKTSEAAAQRYLPFLVRCIERLRALGLSPCLLLHDAKADEPLVAPLLSLLQDRIRVLTSDDPVELKGILGRAEVVIASRFHALVGALSQAVPCLATGWSHKYRMLFRDFGCEKFLLDSDATDEAIATALDGVLAGTSRSTLIDSLRVSAAEQVEAVGLMWQEVDSVLGIKPLSNHAT